MHRGDPRTRLEQQLTVPSRGPGLRGIARDQTREVTTMFFPDQVIATLHVARVAGVATPELVAASLEIDEMTASSLLGEATERGLLNHRPTGRMAGWMATAAGRELHAQEIRTALDRSDLAEQLAEVDRRFVAVNGPFKELCTRWQLEGQPTSCIDDLGAIHGDATDIVASLTALDSRFGRYQERLDAALDRLRAGDEAAFTKPLCGSYHDVWMELHQDLLLTACRERTMADGH